MSREGEMSRKYGPGTTGAAKLSFTISAEAANEMRRLAEEEGVALAELVRRAMGLYSFVQSLLAEEGLYLRNRNTDELSRVVLVGL
jgi:hypothetical protein